MKRIYFIIPILILFFNSHAQELEEINLEANKVVTKTAEESWKIISNWERLHELVPKVVAKTKVTGQGLDSTWEIDLLNGGKIIEKMVYYNLNNKEMAYIMTETPMPIQDYFATIKVEPYGISKSMVSFYTRCKTKSSNTDGIYKMFESFQNNYLNNLEKI